MISIPTYRFDVSKGEYQCPHLNTGVVCQLSNGLCVYMLDVLSQKNLLSTGTMNDGGCAALQTQGRPGENRKPIL